MTMPNIAMFSTQEDHNRRHSYGTNFPAPPQLEQTNFPLASRQLKS